jgi:hypothetical protein
VQDAHAYQIIWSATVNSDNSASVLPISYNSTMGAYQALLYTVLPLGVDVGDNGGSTLGQGLDTDSPLILATANAGSDSLSSFTIVNYAVTINRPPQGAGIVGYSNYAFQATSVPPADNVTFTATPGTISNLVETSSGSSNSWKGTLFATQVVGGLVTLDYTVNGDPGNYVLTGASTCYICSLGQDAP